MSRSPLHASGGRMILPSALLVALASQISIQAFTSAFNVSVAIVLFPVFLFLNPETPILAVALLAAPGSVPAAQRCAVGLCRNTGRLLDRLCTGTVLLSHLRRSHASLRPKGLSSSLAGRQPAPSGWSGRRGQFYGAFHPPGRGHLLPRPASPDPGGGCRADSGWPGLCCAPWSAMDSRSSAGRTPTAISVSC